ncbi:MAG: sensor histidine kinase, partial [Bacteroidaceae bacterium]|nr:sensor histidine kinase [Bacteroidaceae bacterium]
ADTLLPNLIKNAYVHNHADGEIDIVLQENSLCISNTGSPEALDGESIFTRFHHAPDKAESTGLGLSIAQAICRNQGLRLRYEFKNGKHAFIVGKT